MEKEYQIKEAINIDRFYVLPDSQGTELLNDISNAKRNIDITIYSIASTEVMLALAQAVTNHKVKIRIICDRNEGLRNFKTLHSSYNFLKEKLGDVFLQDINFFWSSPFYAISHQKTILIDHLNNDGTFGFVPNETKCYILTGNLFGFKAFTQQEEKFYSARDYYMVLESLENAANINQIYNIFFNDLYNKPVDISEINQSLVYSNGIKQISENKIVRDKFPYISIFGISKKDYQIMGNSLDAMLYIINNAKRSLIIGTQDVGNDELLEAIINKAKEGLDISVLSNGQDKHINEFSSSLIEFGVKCFETRPQQRDFYHHAKYIIADEEIMLVGSINFSSSSLYLNRELAIITRTKFAIDKLIETFNFDCNRKEVMPIHMMTENNKTENIKSGELNPIVFN